jgi:ABC-type Fe3+/spermidine/putrescine transport system ATPase subunit
VRVADASVMMAPPQRRGIAMVFADLALFDEFDVAENVRYGLRAARWSAPDREMRVAELLRFMELEERGRERVDQLTPAEQLRLAIARAVAPEPSVLLLDSPLDRFEGTERADQRVVLRELLRRLQVTVLVAFEQVDDAAAVADELFILDEGTLQQSGPVADVLSYPASTTIARLGGWVTVLDGRVEGNRVNELGVGAIEIPPGGGLDGRVEVLGHPAALLAVPAGRGLGIGIGGAISAVRPEGPVVHVEVLLGGQRHVLVRWEWDAAPPPAGSRVDLVARPGTLRYFRLEPLSRPERAYRDEPRRLPRPQRDVPRVSVLPSFLERGGSSQSPRI